MQPGAKRRAALEAVKIPPGADHRVLHCVLGIEGRAEHAVAEPGQLARQLLVLRALKPAEDGGLSGRGLLVYGHAVSIWPGSDSAGDAKSSRRIRNRTTRHATANSVLVALQTRS